MSSLSQIPMAPPTGSLISDLFLCFIYTIAGCGIAMQIGTVIGFGGAIGWLTSQSVLSFISGASLAAAGAHAYISVTTPRRAIIDARRALSDYSQNVRRDIVPFPKREWTIKEWACIIAAAATASVAIKKYIDASKHYEAEAEKRQAKRDVRKVFKLLGVVSMVTMTTIEDFKDIGIILSNICTQYRNADSAFRLGNMMYDVLFGEDERRHRRYHRRAEADSSLSSSISESDSDSDYHTESSLHSHMSIDEVKSDDNSVDDSSEDEAPQTVKEQTEKLLASPASPQLSKIDTLIESANLPGSRRGLGWRDYTPWAAFTRVRKAVSRWYISLYDSAVSRVADTVVVKTVKKYPGQIALVSVGAIAAIAGFFYVWNSRAQREEYLTDEHGNKVKASSVLFKGQVPEDLDVTSARVMTKVDKRGKKLEYYVFKSEVSRPSKRSGKSYKRVAYRKTAAKHHGKNQDFAYDPSGSSFKQKPPSQDSAYSSGYDTEHMRPGHSVMTPPKLYEIRIADKLNPDPSVRSKVDGTANCSRYGNFIAVPRHLVAAAKKIYVIIGGKEYALPSSYRPSTVLTDCALFEIPADLSKHMKPVARGRPFASPVPGHQLNLFYTLNGELHIANGTCRDKVNLGPKGEITTYRFDGSSQSGACGGWYIDCVTGKIVGFHGIGAKGSIMPEFYPCSDLLCDEMTGEIKLRAEKIKALEDRSYTAYLEKAINTRVGPANDKPKKTPVKLAEELVPISEEKEEEPKNE